jgi:hypothetical protein
MSAPQTTPNLDLSAGMVGKSQPAAATTPAPSAAASPAGGAGVDLSAGMVSAAENDPTQSGYQINDVGNKVIVPKDGENFTDTMKRAVAHHQSMSPEERKTAYDKEVATMPAKTAQTLAAAASAGLVGPAALAAPGEAMEAIPSVLAHTTSGVKAIGAWAQKNPVQAYIVFQMLKELVPGAKKAMGIVREAPDAE